MNMVAMIMYLPGSERLNVIPVVKPTVPKADTSSKSSARNDLSGSKMVSRKVENKIMLIEKNNSE
jgi:hypothetical protein